MAARRLTPGFGVYFDPTKSTSGQRFFADLYRALERDAIPLALRPSVVLFNVSAPIGEIARARWRRQTIVLRIDGLYADRLSGPFIATFRAPLRALLSLGLKYPRLHDVLSFCANLLNENYTTFARILLADWIIYQSRFSHRVHAEHAGRSDGRRAADCVFRSRADA